MHIVRNINARRAARSGQVALFLIFIIVGIFTLVVLNVDVWAAITGKNRTQNAGDAAALAASRQQGISLNQLGRLNLEHVVACLDYDYDRIAQILAEQNHIKWMRPLEGFRAAQEAARKNGMKDDDEFAGILKDRALYLENINSVLEPEDRVPQGYIDELRSLAYAGVCAAPDNAQFINPDLPHVLLDPEFYQAVNGRDWCWFHFNQMALLSGYNSYNDWSPLPDFSVVPDECEINRLEVRFAAREVLDVMKGGAGGTAESAAQRLVELLAENGYGATALGVPITAELILTNRLIGVNRPFAEEVPGQVWCFYKEGKWGSWTEIDPYGEEQFPVIGRVKEEFDVSGCGAAYRVKDSVTNLTLNSTRDMDWIAAAKPFGYVEADGERRPATEYNYFIVPRTFQRSRLIPADAIPGGVFGMSDPEWLHHILPDPRTGESHLTRYYAGGPTRIPLNCRYCAALITWEKKSFREQGVLWLKLYSGTCRRPGGGGHHSGGTHHGH